MISVSDALDQVLDLFTPLEIENVSIADAGGRVLAHDVSSKHDQPPFASSAMDGYAVKSSDVVVGNTLKVIGESAAGAQFGGTIATGQAVRIFTGAPVPQGADKVLIQEDCKRVGNTITVSDGFDKAAYIRAQGCDFAIGETMCAPLLLGPNEVALLAAMNIGTVPVRRKPIVALVATGNELVYPGEHLGPDQITSSNNFGLKAMAQNFGAEVRILPIARDDVDSLRTVLDLCQGADVIVTLGGASVGDHDIVGQLAQSGQMETSFYKVAMRPGKPLMAGRYKDIPLIGLPGNPVSSMVCGHVFLQPAINAMLGLEKSEVPHQSATLASDLGPNGPRTHYMRATLQNGQCVPFERQDSSLLSVLANSNALMIRAPNERAQKAGATVKVIPF